MRRMSGTDSLFLAGETPNWHQHIGGLVVLDPSERDDFSFDRVVAQVSERLMSVPKLTWKLKTVPLDLDRAVWIDDESFDVRRHVHRMTVAAPGGPRETAATIAPILSRQLDRRFPLWELWYLDGLANGRVAVLMKMHHCLLDGGAGSVLAELLFDLEADPAPRDVPARPPVTVGPPSDLRLVLGSVVANLGIPLRIARYGVRQARRTVDLVGHLWPGRVRPDVGTLLNAPRTSFNVPIGPRRSLAFGSVALADVKAVAAHFDATVNEVALALCGGALREYLDARDELPERELTVGAPVSMRAKGDTAMNNQLSYLVVPFGTHLDDPVERLRRISEQSKVAKDIHKTMRAHPVGSIADTAPPFVLASLMRLAYETHILSYVPGMMNTVVSNVPGPPMDLYLAGARLSGIFSASVLLDCMGINLTLFSFGDRMDFGLHVDPDLIEDPWSIAVGLRTELGRLMAAAGLGPAQVVPDAFGLTDEPPAEGDPDDPVGSDLVGAGTP